MSSWFALVKHSGCRACLYFLVSITGPIGCAPILASKLSRPGERWVEQQHCEQRRPGERWPEMARRLHVPLRLLLQGQQPDNQQQACLPASIQRHARRSSSGPSGRMQQLSWPVQGILTSHYGVRYGRMHEGIDIGAPKGQLIRSAATGKIIRADYHPTYGNVVVVLHPSGFRTLYAHQDRILVRLGQQVRRGEIIGKIGATGRATGPHLHFEVHQVDGPVDPLPYLVGDPFRHPVEQRVAM